MKILSYCLLLVLFFISCTTTENPEGVSSQFIPKKQTYMTHDQIVQELTKLSLSEQKADPTDKAYQLRKANLMPDKEFKLSLQKTAKLTKKKVQKAIVLVDSDLRSRDTEIKTQDGPRCTAWATVAAMENTLNKSKTLAWDLSEMHLWSKYKEYSTEIALDAAYKYKIADEIEYPTGGSKKSTADKNAKYQITKYNYLGENPDDAVISLSKGNVVVIGMETPTGLLNCNATVSPTTSAAGGGHAIAIVGFQKDSSVKGGGYFIFKNSWGADCGDKGYQYVPLHALCAKSSFYCYFWDVESVTSSDSPVPNPIPTPVPDEPKKEEVCVKWERIWYMPWKYRCVEWEWVVVK